MEKAAVPPHIFVVDDDEGLLLLVAGALKREKWTVATATSGADALAWLQTNSADLLLLDLKLRDLEGREFIAALSDAGRSVPFIIITGQGDERVAVEMMKRGALDYLVKDVNFIEFIPTVVRRALARLADEKRLAGAEHALRVSEQRFRSTLDNMLEGCQTVGFDWRYLYVNEAAARHGRRPVAELLGRTMMEAYPGINDARWFGRLQDCMTHRTSSHLEIPFVYADGEAAWFQLSVQPVPEGLFILSLDITERKRLEREILEISEREQRRIGHDLHDGLGQRLTGLEMLSHALAEDLKGHPPALARQARRLNRDLRETVTQARLISHSLAPVPLDGDGLMRGLSELAASTSRIPGVACRFICDSPVRIQDVPTATHLYRIAQEAVNNGLKHGQARKIEITLAERADGLVLSVENNGRAIPSAPRPTSGLGLNVMRYRAEMIDANLSIESGKRRGVRVTCSVRRQK